MIPSCCLPCYLDALTRDHEAQQAEYYQHATPARLLQVFPGMEAIYTAIMRSRIKAHKARRQELTAKRVQHTNSLATTPHAQRWAVELCVEITDEKIAKHDNDIKKLAFQINSLQAEHDSRLPEKGNNRITEPDIARAKEYPIADILAGAGVSMTRSTSSRLVCHCPLGTHNEKTPSFTVYANQNSFWCYSCSKGGDSIALYMTIMHVSFTQAVKKLCGIL